MNYDESPLHHVSSLFFKNCICTFLTHFCLALLHVILSILFYYLCHFFVFSLTKPCGQAPQEVRPSGLQICIWFSVLHCFSLPCAAVPSPHPCFCCCQAPAHFCAFSTDAGPIPSCPFPSDSFLLVVLLWSF